MDVLFGRRDLLHLTGAALAGATLNTAEAGAAGGVVKIVGISCSPRKGKTTTAAVTVALDAARAAVPGAVTELIELADYSIPAQIAAGVPLRAGEVDDFPALEARLSDPGICGILVATPVYFGNMSALCKAFLDRCMAFRKNNFLWRHKVAGGIAVGSTRNGGQELTLECLRVALQGQDMIFVGTGQPSVRIGATLWNQDDSIAQDEFGLGTARDLGRHVAEMAALLQAARERTAPA